MKKNKKWLAYLLLVIAVYMATISISYSQNIQFTLTQNDPNEMAKSVVGNTGTVSETWSAEYSHDLVLISSDDVLIPVEIEKPTLTLINDNHGVFMFSNDQVRAVTRTPIVSFTHSNLNTFNIRPTLFISI